MARIRTIKPEFPHSESMGRVSRDARLLFILLWTIADDAGRARASSRMLASLLYPYDDDAPSLIDGWLDELEREHCITRYSVGGNTYLEVGKWLEHQKIDRPSKSKFPGFGDDSTNPREPSRTLVGGSGPVPVSGRDRDHVPGACASDEHAETSTTLANTREPSTNASRETGDDSRGSTGVPAPAAPIAEPSDYQADARDVYDAEQTIRTSYPSHPHLNDWLAALRVARMLVENRQATWQQLVEAVRRYSAYVTAGGVSEAKYVMTPVKFFRDGGWQQPWVVPKAKAEQRTDANLSAVDQARKAIFGGSK